MLHWSKVICYVDMVVKISSISIDLFDFWWRFSVDMPAILDHSAILTQYQALFQAKQRLSHWKTTHQRKKRVKKREGVEKFSKADNKIDKSIACTFSLHNPIAILLFFFLCCVCVICQKQKKKMQFQHMISFDAGMLISDRMLMNRCFVVSFSAL